MISNTRVKAGRRLGIVGGAVTALALAVSLVATPASGLGFKQRQCYSNGIAYGGSTTTAANTAITNGVVECGQARARARYYNSSGVLVWTGWAQHYNNATALVPAGGTGYQGQHTVTLPGVPYMNNFPFTT